jgi:hypothetical protein
MEFNDNHLDNTLWLFESYIDQHERQRKSITYAIVAVLTGSIVAPHLDVLKRLPINALVPKYRHFLNDRTYVEDKKPLEILALGVDGAYSPRGYIKYHDINDRDLFELAKFLRMFCLDAARVPAPEVEVVQGPLTPQQAVLQGKPSAQELVRVYGFKGEVPYLQNTPGLDRKSYQLAYANQATRLEYWEWVADQLAQRNEA